MTTTDIVLKLKALAKAAYEDLPDWRPDIGLTKAQQEFCMAASPATLLLVAALIEHHESLHEHMKSLREAHGYDSWTAVLVAAENPKAASSGSVDLANFDWDAEMTAFRKDAERYRWLREYTTKAGPVHGALSALDRQIDDAMSRSSKL